MRHAIKVNMPIWTTFKLLMGILIVFQVQCFQEGICPQKDIPRGVRVLAPGSKVTLHCSGQITVDGRALTGEGDGRGTSKNPTRTSRAGDSARLTEEYGREQPGRVESEGLDRASYGKETVNLTSEDRGSMLGRGLNGSQTEGAQSFAGGAVEKANTSSFDRPYDEAMGAVGRVVRGLRQRVQWRVDGHSRIRGGDEGDVLKLNPLRLSDSGVYSCHRGGKKVFYVRIIVAGPPEQPTLSCYRKTPTSNISCDWMANKTVTPTPQCYLVLRKGLYGQLSKVSCSFSVLRARCRCVMEHGEGEETFLATLCVTSIAANVTSPEIEIHPLNIIKPDFPRNLTVHAKDGMERRLKVTWSYPNTWRPDFYHLKFHLQYVPISNGELHKEDSWQDIRTKRLFHSINDVLLRTTYLLRIRAREEFDMGQWSNWCPYVHARSWTAPEPSATSGVHFSADIHSFYYTTGSGYGPEDELPAVSSSSHPSTLMRHLPWVFGVCLFLILTMLAVYILRHRKQFISKLLKLGQSSTTHNPAPPPTQLPIEEGSPLVSPDPSAPPLSKEPPFLQEGEERGQGIHLNNMGYFLVQTN